MLRQEDIVNDILRIVAMPSFTDNVEDVVKCQMEYQAIAKRMGFKTRFEVGCKVLVVEPKRVSKSPKIGIVVHLDTVPFAKSEWRYNPLGEVANDRIYGRGVVDDKAAAIMALYAVKELKGKAANSWQIIVGSCEEGDWSDMVGYMNSNPTLPRFLFTIDGDGVQNGCRGYADLELEFRRETDIPGVRALRQLYVPNPTNNVVPAKAVAKVWQKVYEQEGKAAHSSIPEMGENALIELTDRLKDVKEVVREFPGFFKLMDRLREDDIQKSIGFPTDEVFCGDGCKTIAVPVGCSLHDDTLTLNLNVRLCVHSHSMMMSKVIMYLCLHYNCNCYMHDMKLPAYVDADSVYIQKMLESYKEVLGIETKPSIAMGVGYNAALPNCAIFGPRFAALHDEEDCCHAVDESRKIFDVMKFTEMLVHYLKNVLA